MGGWGCVCGLWLLFVLFVGVFLLLAWGFVGCLGLFCFVLYIFLCFFFGTPPPSFLFLCVPPVIFL